MAQRITELEQKALAAGGVGFKSNNNKNNHNDSYSSNPNSNNSSNSGNGSNNRVYKVHDCTHGVVRLYRNERVC